MLVSADRRRAVGTRLYFPSCFALVTPQLPLHKRPPSNIHVVRQKLNQTQSFSRPSISLPAEAYLWLGLIGMLKQHV